MLPMLTRSNKGVAKRDQGKPQWCVNPDIVFKLGEGS